MIIFHVILDKFFNKIILGQFSSKLSCLLPWLLYKGHFWIRVRVNYVYLGTKLLLNVLFFETLTLFYYMNILLRKYFFTYLIPSLKSSSVHLCKGVVLYTQEQKFKNITLNSFFVEIKLLERLLLMSLRYPKGMWRKQNHLI